MAKVLTDSSNYTAIAAAIRSKNGASTQYKPAQMAQAIKDISTGSGTDTSDATASGNVTLSADASEIVADTGLAAVNGFILYKEADAGKNSTHGWIKTDIASFLMYFTYSTHFPTKGYDTEVDGLIAVSGGTVTCKQRSSSYPICSGTYNWIAW